jgi:hypothetical protein
MRLTEELLATWLEEHRDRCEVCTPTNRCVRSRRIEASFYDEVDRKIDEEKERRRG